MAKKRPVNKKVKINYSIITLMFIVVGLAIVLKASSTYFIDGTEWREIGDKQKGRTIPAIPKRGNIYSANYELMATTEERYRLYMDFFAQPNIKDKLTPGMIDTLAREFGTILPDANVRYFKSRLQEGVKMVKDFNSGKSKRKSRKYKVLDTEVNYTQMKAIREMPYFKEGRNKSGLIADPINARVNPYGSLALRTIGGVYANTEVDGKIGKNGLELHYDSLLRGTPGIAQIQRISGQEVQRIQVEPIEGKDIVTTIDTDIQELAEKALLAQLQEVSAESGTAIVMEVETGYIKAIANMGNRNGVWGEHQNYALSYMNEPGSTFKVVSMMVALEDGMVQPHTVVETGNGVWHHKGVPIRDHNSHRGGYQTIDAAKSIVVSSNIGVAKLMYQAYDSNPQKFMDGVMATNAFGDLELEIPGYGIPRMRKVKGPGWSTYSLEKMSYGYENMIPPISILTFFNGLANNGEVLRPLFIKEVMQDGRVVERKKKVVLNPKMCSSGTVAALKEMLYGVVNDKEWGTGKPAQSQFFSIAGKTATAQILNPQGGLIGHQVGFCGYFPAENPKYSCIVTVRRPKEHNPSGGRIAGGVFKKIAEGMYARNFITASDVLPVDTLRAHEPVIKPGYEAVAVESGLVPDVKGMGARDATYALESSGLKVSLRGRGAVKTQSIKAGSKIRRGESIILHLE